MTFIPVLMCITAVQFTCLLRLTTYIKLVTAVTSDISTGQLSTRFAVNWATENWATRKFSNGKFGNHFLVVSVKSATVNWAMEKWPTDS